jgi:hypothetical protein
VVKEFLSQQGVDFTVKNVVTDLEAREEFLRAGFRLPPVTVIGGVAVEGFQPERLEALLLDQE